MYQKILVATDGSALSKKAVRGAIGLAESLGAQLVALHVVPHYPISFFEGGMAISPEDIARAEGTWHDKGQETVDAVVKQAKASGVTAKGVVIQSDLVADAIQAAARKNKCDLIVMASH